MVMAAFHKLVSRVALGGWWSRRRCWAGIATWCDASGRRSVDDVASVDRGWKPTFAGW